MITSELLQIVHREDGCHFQRRRSPLQPWETLVVFEWNENESREETMQRAEEALFAEINATADIMPTADIDTADL